MGRLSTTECTYLSTYLPALPRGPALVRYASSGPETLSPPVRCPVTVVLSPAGGFAPPDLLGGCAGHVEAGQEPCSWCLPLAPVESMVLSSLCVVPVWGPATGLSLAGPSGVSLGLRALQLFGACGPGDSRSRFRVPSLF